MDEKKRNEVVAFIWFAASLLVLLSLVSYTPDDLPFEVSTPNFPVHNFVGPFGAYTGWTLRMLFGKTAYFLVPVFLLWSLAKWSGKKSQVLWLRIFSIAIFLTSACSLFSLIAANTESNRFQAGGIIGHLISIFLSSVFGHAGLLVSLVLFRKPFDASIRFCLGKLKTQDTAKERQNGAYWGVQFNKKIYPLPRVEVRSAQFSDLEGFGFADTTHPVATLADIVTEGFDLSPSGNLLSLDSTPGKLRITLEF